MAAGKVTGRACWKCAKQPDLKEVWACEPTEAVQFILYEQTEREMHLHRCPMHHVTPEVARIFESYWPYREGQWLPYGGGLWEQPHYLVTAWRLLDQLFEELKVDGG